MASSKPSCGPPGRLLILSAELSEAETVQTAITRVKELVETAFEQPVTSVCTYDPATNTVSTLDSSIPSSTRVEGAPDQIPESLIDRAGERRDDLSPDDTPEAVVDTDPREPFQAEVLVPVRPDRILCVGVTELERLDETGIATIEGIAANLQTALSRIDHRQSAAVGCDVARALFDQSDDATFVSDTDGRLVAVNRAAVELTGRDRDALLTNGLSDISGGTAVEPVREHLERTVTGASDPLTTTLEHADDGDLTVELTSRRVDVDGTNYIRTIAQDPPSGVQSQLERSENTVADDAAALRQLNKLTVGADEFDETIERLLSLGCAHFGLDTGILSRVDGDDYEVDAVVDATGSHEAGTVYDLGDTMCDATLANDGTEPLAFADVADTDHRSHPAAENVRAYIAAPVVVDGETYGTVNFSMGRPRPEAFRPEEREFAKLVAQWIGTEIERRRRFEELERYETILEAVGDPVYALDTDGRFTFVNEAAEREFGYSKEVVGRHPSVGMDDSDVKQMQEQIEGLLAAGDRSTTAEFELETADGGQKTVENRLALIGDEEFRGTAGVLRDITARKERQRQLESFQRAVESARDGVAVLDGDEYTYVDQTHVDMYGFEDTEQLLGNTWRKLYDDEEIERLEAEAFPALESEGYWRGMVTGSRPDGSTFPAELSLTIIEGGRLVCTVRDETERKRRERELELKERAMDEANVGIQITDSTEADNTLAYVNDGFERMTGYTREEALGRNPRFLQGDDTDSEQVARLRAAIDAEEPVSLELRNERRDGTLYWSRISITPVRDEGGAVQNYIGIQQDVTERKERERRLEARRDFLRRIYEVTTDPELTFEEKVSGLLATGRDHLDLPYGFLTRIETGDESASGIQTIVEALGSHDRLQPDESASLSQSYCRKTIGREGPTAVTHAAEAGWVDDPAYEAFELETYVGAEVVAGDDLYGTLCFASKEPRDRSFDEFELSFIRLVGRWIGYEIDRRNARGELQAQRERLELTLSGTNTGIAEWDLATDAVTLNETFTGIVGREVDSVEAFMTAVHPDDRDRVQRELERMVETGDPWAGEFRMIDDDGDTLWLGTRATPVYDDEETPVRVLATGTNISDKKERERELEESQNRYQTLLQAAPDPVFIADAETGEVVEANVAAEEILGQPRNEIVGRDQTELHPDGDAKLYREAFEQSVGRSEIISELPDGTQPELRTADGETVPIEINADTVELPHGQVMYGVFRDVSERRERERELELKERAMDEAQVGITISDPNQEDNPLIYANDGFVDQTGYTRADALGHNCRFLQGDDREQTALDNLRNAIADNEETTVELRNYRKDGEQFWNRLSVTPVYDEDGELTNHIGIQQDVTEEKTREQRLRAIHGTTRDLLRADSSEDAAAVAVESLATEFEFQQSALYLRADDALVNTAMTGASDADPPDRVEQGRTPLWDALETGEPVQYDDCGAIDDDVDRGDVTASAYFPVGDHGALAVGVTDPDRLGESDRRLVEVLTGNLVAVLDRFEREASLRASEKRYRGLAENIPNGGVLTFDADLEYRLAAGELLPELGLETSSITGMSAGTVLPDIDDRDELVSRLQAALDGERTDRRVELDNRTLRIYIVPVDAGDGHADATRGLVLAQDVTEEAQRQRELFEEREQFRLLTESVDEYAFFVVDGEGVIQTWNKGADRTFGYDAEAAIGMSMAELHPEPDREADVPARLMQQARVSGESAHEGRRVRADGSEFYADVRHAPLEADDDAFRGYATVVRDMTDRRRERRRTERFVEESDDVVTIVDPDGTVTYASGSASRVLGYDPDELVGENLFDYLHPDGREHAMKTFFTCVEDSDKVKAECRLGAPDGGWINVEGRCRNMLDDDAIDGVLVYLRDVTETKKRTRRFESIFNGTFQFTGLLEPDGTVVEVNDAALEFGGVERDAIVGNPFFDASWWTHSEAVRDDVRGAIDRAAGGEFVRYETEARGADGLRTLDFSVKPVTDEDEEVSMLVVEGRDITAREQHKRHMEVIQRVMRHNMRNDLTKMRGWTQVMAEETDAEKRAEYFETVERVLDKWASMTEKMKEIRTVLESQQGQETRKEAEALIEDAIAPVREEDAGGTVVTDVPDTGLQVPATLLDAVRELVENAAEASAEATIEVELDRSTDGWTEIFVRDDGPGMPDMEADVLETGEETPLNHGQGLGLWMVRMIVTQAGGESSVESTGDGTAVCLRVPVRRTVEGERSAEATG